MGGVDPVALVPEAAVAVAAVTGLLLGGWLPRHRQWIVRLLALSALAVALAATIVLAGRPPQATASGTYVLDVLLHAVRAVVLAGTALVVLLSADRVAGHRRETEYHVLLLLGALGTIVVAGAGDLLVLAVGYLLASIPLYALAGFGKDARGTEAALKYYLMGALFTVVLLVGAALLLGAGGATGYTELARRLPDASGALVAVGAVAVAGGLLFKAGGVPAHFWVPDVTEGASAPVAAFVTTVPKVGALAALFRLGGQVLAGVEVDWPPLVALVAAATMSLGNLAAFFQDNARRLLAYSTVGQVGYLLTAVAAVGTGLALPGLLFYLAAYTVTNLGAFAVVCALPEARDLGDFTGLFRRRPWLSLGLVVCLLGLVGTPPTAVFVGKLTVFTAAFDAGLVWLVVVALANTVASLFYYLRWVLPLFRRVPSDDGRGPAAGAGPQGRGAAAVAVAAAALSVALGVAAGPFLTVLS
ncbi:NADH-quinone oxidoreductase subunit N [Thermobifida halotolerans]|uniref:NADH-quinone oxidoreductase subunit N n=2 Tax=Thermobifida halotolerans TaxID=483545 RepID=A0A399G726_9ACTN|nr:NADH-quinone oxidoreductase subunit N [Thermobifida halotolerans]UOE21907.1 NADH-quinone oxidoreductase subunit N [Thermobifida halotolerans]